MTEPHHGAGILGAGFGGTLEDSQECQGRSKESVCRVLASFGLEGGQYSPTKHQGANRDHGPNIWGREPSMPIISSPSAVADPHVLQMLLGLHLAHLCSPQTVPSGIPRQGSTASPLQPSAIQWGMPGATEIHLMAQHQGCPPQLSHPGSTTLCGSGAPGKQGMEPGCNRGWSGQGTGRTMQVMGLEGVTAAPGHMQPVPRATGLLFLDCLEETLLPDRAAPTEMKRPFSPCPFSLPVHARVARTCAHPQHGAVLARPAPLPPANIFSNDLLLLLQRSSAVLQKSLKTQQLCFDEFA